MEIPAIEALPQGEAFTSLVGFAGESVSILSANLHATNDIHMVWWIMGVVGTGSAVGIYMYGRWLVAMSRHETPAQAQAPDILPDRFAATTLPE